MSTDTHMPVSSRRLRGRPLAVTSYAQDMSLLNTPSKRRWTLALIVAGFVVPFLFTDDLLRIAAFGMITAVGAIGLNLIIGYAGQISLAHAFFIGLGAYAAAVLGGSETRAVIGYDLPMWIWLPGAGLVAALVGLLIGPLAVRLRGLYLAIVTLGLVFLGQHLFSETRNITGNPTSGRRAANMEIFGFDLRGSGEVFGIWLGREQRLFLFALIFLIVFALLARNIARSGVGRAFSAVRDRDVAAAVIGINLSKYKLMAFAISSFYAGITGAAYYAALGQLTPADFNLQMSIQYLAMILIGGVATISGAIMGAMFVAFLGRISGEIGHLVPGLDGLLSTSEIELVLYGLLIIGFLIFEPRGLFGIWMRIRNYWKGWPFSY